MTRLPSHFLVINKQYPTNDEFMHLVDKEMDAAYGHWYWEGEFHELPFERTPVFRWSPPSWPHRGRYVVARLLWVAANLPVIGRYILRNTCGVYACVNPAHWENASRERHWTIAENTDAVLVRATSPGHEPKIHLRHADSIYTACYSTLHNSNPQTLPAEERVRITCEACVSAWQELGHPLEELPCPASGTPPPDSPTTSTHE